ncbi:MAG: SRPBCC domain-containing protein [Phycisphaerales bacterium]|nr:SRPBCC domain-containing protein [Phycisphaerales bacterium]
MPETIANPKVAPPSLYKVVIRAPIQDVWSEITRTDAPIACFFNSRMTLGPGGLAPGTKLAMRTPNGRMTGVVGEILEIVPLKRFSHTFRFTNMDDPPCRVTYELEEVAEGTQFTLIVSDAIEGSKSLKQMAQGAALICKTLKSVMETGRPSLGVRLLFTLFKVAPAPKRCRSENWPVD